MVKSVIGGFQKMTKNKKSLDDDFYKDSNKKKKKVKRSSSKFDKIEKNDTDNLDDNNEDFYDE